MKEILVTRRTCLYGRMLLHRLQEADASSQVFRLWLSGLHGHGSLLPSTAHRPLPVHDLLPEWNLISDVVIYQPIHTFQVTQPLFQFLFLGLCRFTGNCVFFYWIILRVMLVDQIQQILHWRVILRFRFLNVVF